MKSLYHMNRVELLATALEYEHALHVVIRRDQHVPAVCVECQRLAQSALDGESREMFMEIASEGTSEKMWVRKGVLRELTDKARSHKRRADNERRKRQKWRKRALSAEKRLRRWEDR